MGTPVKIRARELQCTGAGVCSEPRQMTEAEIIKYGINKKGDELMGNRIAAPAKEKLVEVLAYKKGRTNAIHHAAKTFMVSDPTIYKWIKEFNIAFDNTGLVIKDLEPIPPQLEQEREINKIEEHENTINTAGQELKKLPDNLGYAEYDIGNIILQIDYREKLIKILSNNNDNMTFEEAKKVNELLSGLLVGR